MGDISPLGSSLFSLVGETIWTRYAMNDNPNIATLNTIITRCNHELQRYQARKQNITKCKINRERQRGIHVEERDCFFVCLWNAKSATILASTSRSTSRRLQMRPPGIRGESGHAGVVVVVVATNAADAAVVADVTIGAVRTRLVRVQGKDYGTWSGRDGSRRGGRMQGTTGRRASLLDQLKARRNLDDFAGGGAGGIVFVRDDPRHEFLEARRGVAEGRRWNGFRISMKTKTKLHRRLRLSVEADLTDVVDATVQLL